MIVSGVMPTDLQGPVRTSMAGANEVWASSTDPTH